MKEVKKNLSTEEKMIRSFKICNDIIIFLEALVVFAVIGGIISFINLCIKCKFDVVKLRDTVLADIGFYDDNGFASDYQGLPEHIGNEITDDGEAYVKPSNIYKCCYIIGFILKIVSLLVILGLLGKILSDSIKQKTPFVKKNIERMKLMAICSIFSSQKLIYFIIIIMVEQLFKYGYELQVESDELL